MRDKRKTAGIYLVLTILALLTLAPLAFLLINSFKSQAEIVDDPLALPSHFTLEYLVNAAQTIQFPKALALTIFITVVSVGLLVIILLLCGLDDGAHQVPGIQGALSGLQRRHADSLPVGHVSAD